MNPPPSDYDQGRLIEALVSQALPRNAFDALADSDSVEVVLVDSQSNKHGVVFYQKGYQEGNAQGNLELRNKFIKAGTAFSPDKQNLKFKTIKINHNLITIECEFAQSTGYSWLYANTVSFTLETKDLYFNKFDLNTSSLEQLPPKTNDIELPVYNSLIPQILPRDAFDGFSERDAVIIHVGENQQKRPVVFYQKANTNKFIKAGKAHSPYKQNLSLIGIRTSDNMLELDYEFIESTYFSKLIAAKTIGFTVVTKLVEDNLLEDLSQSSLHHELRSEMPMPMPAPVFIVEDQCHAMEKAYERLRSDLIVLNRMPKPKTPHDMILRDRHLVEFGQKVKQAEADLNKDPNAEVIFSFWYAYIFGELKQLPKQSMATGVSRGKKVSNEHIEKLERPGKELHQQYARETPEEKAQRLALIEEQRKTRMRERRNY